MENGRRAPDQPDVPAIRQRNQQQAQREKESTMSTTSPDERVASAEENMSRDDVAMASESDPGAESASASSSRIPPVALFQGFDTFTSAGLSTTVEGESQSGGAFAQTYYQVCHDVSSLRRALNVSGSVSASFGFGSVDAKSSFVDSLNITNTSITIVVYTNIVSSAQTKTNVRFIDGPPADIRAFCRSYGDSYVAQIVTGAEYAAAYVFYSESIEQRREITATLNAKGISTGGSLTASLQTTLTEVRSQVSTRKALRQFMSGFRNPVFPDEQGIITTALNFGSRTPDAPAVISYDTEGYERVPAMPMVPFSPVVATRTLYNGIGAQNGLAADYAQLSANRNSVAAIKTVHGTYGYTGDTALADGERTIRGDIALLDLLFDEMSVDPTKTYTRPALEGFKLGEPSLNVILRLEGPYGGHTGVPFRQVNESSVAESSVLASFSAAGGGWMDRITFAYRSAQGTAEYRQGGHKGVPSPVLLLQTSERVIMISGTYGGYVNSIRIVTSLGNTFAWPPTPQAAPSTFSWKAQGSTVFLGFAGRSGGYLDQLSLVTATFQPARWAPSLHDTKRVDVETFVMTPEAQSPEAQIAV
jgi:hypothetical protein